VIVSVSVFVIVKSLQVPSEMIVFSVLSSGSICGGNGMDSRKCCVSVSIEKLQKSVLFAVMFSVSYIYRIITPFLISFSWKVYVLSSSSVNVAVAVCSGISSDIVCSRTRETLSSVILVYRVEKLIKVLIGYFSRTRTLIGFPVWCL